jgi:hypothetical protein
MRISNSFSEGEVQVLEFMLATILRGGTPTMAARHRDFASLYRKVLSMKARIEQDKKKAAAGAVSSVGTVASPEDTADADAPALKAV